MIAKKIFVEIINAIKEQDEIDEKFSLALETVCDSWCLYGMKNKKYDALWRILKEVMDDKYDIISWWLYEDVDKKIYDSKSGKVLINLDTVEKLYDYLNKPKIIKGGN